MTIRRAVSLAVLFAGGMSHAATPLHPKFGFPVYTNQPSGKQLSGEHTPAATAPLSPDDARKKFVVPPGFEVRLFASEPEVVNPVAMTWDERGRLWVLELYEYPLGAKPGEPGRDRIKILEDTDNDGRADKVTVFLDGLSLATGLLLGNGGAYVGQAPNLYWVEDTDGDGKADRKTIVQTGFGLEDRHELLNGFTWGPDGQLYMTHGVFTLSRTVDPDKPAQPTVLTAGVARFEPKTRRLEVFSEGTSNPWGVDFDARGNAFVSACVIDHFFHLAPGGLYDRQAGQPPYPYAYGLLPSIVDHHHHMAAYAGVCIYQGDQFPAEYKGMALEGNIHANAIHQDRLVPKGSTFAASFVRDFVRANDGWFMPVSTQSGPDGAVWIMDWYDKYPCYQNAGADPGGVDREHGRIWRVVHTGGQPGMPVPSHPPGLDLAKATTADLVKVLAHPNVWHRRMAQRVLGGRPDVASQRPALAAMLKRGPGEDAMLAALWTLFATGLADDGILDEASDSDSPAVRQWAARFTGERSQLTDATVRRLKRLAADESPLVHAAIATALRQLSSGSLTVNTPPRLDPATAGPVLAEVLGVLMENARATTDRDLPFLLWMAIEPTVLLDPNLTTDWFVRNGQRYQPLSGQLAYKTVRRFLDEGKPALLDASLDLLGALPEESALLVPVLDGLLEGQRGRALVPGKSPDALLAKLLANPDKGVVTRAQQLGTAWGDASALKASIARIVDPKASEADRLAAIRSARSSKSGDMRQALLDVVAGPAPDALKVESVRTLSEIGADNTGRLLLSGWAGQSPAVRRAVAELAASRWQWRRPLYTAIEKGDVKRGELPPTVIRGLLTSKSDGERDKAVELFGRYKASGADKLKLIADKRRVVAAGPVDLNAGREVARKTCLACHKFHGEGADVGPDLTGVGRSSLDALLHNVINPNEIIGQGYENVVVETKDGRTLAGRVVENSATRVRVAMAGPTEEIVAKANLKSLTVTANSVMPEGLEQMPDADFRNLIWYILAPPQDGKPLTDERRRELMGGSDEGASNAGPGDQESASLWAPEWRLDCPLADGTPARLVEWAGRRDVLMTHPHAEARPAFLERRLKVGTAQPATLRFCVASHDDGDWRLRVRVDGVIVHENIVSKTTPRWREIRVDLSRFAGREVTVRLENGVGEGGPAFGYWHSLRIDGATVAAR